MSSLSGTYSRPTSNRSSLKRALIVTRRELRDTLRDWRILTPIVSLIMILPLLLAAVVKVGSEGWIERVGYDMFYNKILPFATLSIGFLPMSFCLVIALESFVGEKERNSLEALLTAPLTDFELFLGKYIAAILPPVISSILASVSFGLCLVLLGGTFPVPFGLLLLFILLNVIEALVMVAGSVLVSTHTTSVRAANIMASFIILPMSIIVQLEAALLITNNRNGLFFVFIALIIILVLLLRSGVKIFNREEIVAREGDNVSLRSVLRGFGYFFKRTPNEGLKLQKSGARWTVWRFYRHDIPQIIALNKGTVAVITISLIGAMFIALWISNWPEVIQLRDDLGLKDRINSQTNPICQQNGLNNISFAGINGVTWQHLFTNNVTSTVISSALSTFTLGLVGIAMLMISLGPIGFVGGFLLQLGANPLPLLLGFILPHGVFELPAAVLGVAAGMRVGLALIAPPRGMTIGQSFQFALVNYLKMLALVVPLLLIAAIIEANITPTIGCWITGGNLK
ncbi:MAG TPA: stage II sporulation protein M [Chloroflexia bacterium]|nr:stage II sporulation protein M [Chloroflexia bacterium]